MSDYIYKKKRKRVREISVQRLEEIREVFKYGKKDIAEIIGVSYCQLMNYYKSGYLPIDRYLCIINGLRASIERDARDKRKMLDDIVGIDY